MSRSKLEDEINKQYGKFFTEKDGEIFKIVAEYYLKKAATLKKADVNNKKHALLLRNIQKRLFIGIGCELLLKSLFLSKGYCINKHKREDIVRVLGDPPFLIEAIEKNQKRQEFDENKTYKFKTLINWLPRVLSPQGGSLDKIKKAFEIAKAFRNKEAHIATYSHEYDSQNYSDIENGLIEFYKIAFKQNLKIRISFEPNEKGVFYITTDQ